MSSKTIDIAKVKLSFSGHETFQCRHFWLKKGYEFIIKNGDFKSSNALIELGVGKNMISSISYWLKVFSICDNQFSLTEFSKKIFNENGFDPYLEDIGTQFLLHFNLMNNSNIASIYKLTFEDFRRTRITSEFTEKQLFDFISKKIIQDGYSFSEKSIKNDIRVFLKTYFGGSKRTAKSIEDDFSSILLGLEFIKPVQDIFIDGEQLFRIQYHEQNLLNPLLFLFAILSVFENEESISVEAIQNKISDVFLCNREGTEEKLNKLDEYGLIVFKQDAGRKEIQIKKIKDKWEVLSKYYGRV